MMDARVITPTEEQLHIVDLITNTKDNILVNAYAGTGKTTTLRLIDLSLPKDLPTLYLAFNKRIVEEATGFRQKTIIRTLNSQGHRIWAQTCANPLTMPKQKVGDLLREAIKDLEGDDKKEAWEEFSNITSCVGFAKSLGYVPTNKFPRARRLIEEEDFFSAYTEHHEALSDLCKSLVSTTLASSISAAFAGAIDFNDQIYMPALFGATFPRFPLVLGDEAQDWSPVNHVLLEKLARERLVAVGDPWQTIYGFRGAMPDGMGRLASAFSMTSADLSVSFRCPSAIVRAVHWHVPHLRWSKEGGRASKILNPTLNGFVDGSAIICRNNAPLIRLGFRLLAARRSVCISGSDIGPRIAKVMKKLGEPSMSKVALRNAIEDWRNEKAAKGSTSADDTADCMLVFADYGETLEQAIAYVEKLFDQEGSITLTTGHKSKGLEWPIVYHLDPFLVHDTDQDRNLRYVITTRSQNQFYEINSKDIR